MIPRLVEFVRQMEKRGETLVLAESCTAGLVAATFGRIPGVSHVLCGSMVVYQTAIKERWLDIDAALLFDPSIGPVSEEATKALSSAILRKTPEATWSVAVTGHLGPNAPEEVDGLVFVCLAKRTEIAHRNEPYASHQRENIKIIRNTAFRLNGPCPLDATDVVHRSLRLEEAATRTIAWAIEIIASQG